MKRTKGLREAVTELDFQKVRHELEKKCITDESVGHLLTVVEQTGCLLVQHSEPERERRRDRFYAELLGYLQSHESNLSDRLLLNREQAEMCERGFRAISSNLARSPAGQVDSSVAAWAALHATAVDVSALGQAINTMEPTLVAPNLAFLSPESVRVPVFNTNVDPDNMLEQYAYNLSGYLKMLARNNNWYDQERIVIPEVASVPHELVADRSALFLAEVWNQLDDHWSKICFFSGSSVRAERLEISEAHASQLTVLVFEHDWRYFLDVEVARARLRRQVFELMMHTLGSPDVRAAIRNPFKEPVPLFPHGVISVPEALGEVALDMCYGLKVTHGPTEYLGLTLAEWLRGYALLQLCCEKELCLTKIADGLQYLDEDAFLSISTRAGLQRNRAVIFLKQATFQKNSRDLFDTPLIRTADGHYALLSSIVKASALAEILTSRLNSLLLQNESKGLQFEKEVRAEFERLGAKVRELKYKNQEGSFQCDAAVWWGRHLLLAECKAHTLPRQTASDLYFFRLKQQEATEQILRVRRHCAANPEILDNAFGERVDAERTTLCVINLAPYSTPTYDEEVRFYDRRAIAKFSEGVVEGLIVKPDGSIERNAGRVQHRLWTGFEPTPDDLVDEMRQAYQYSTERASWEIRNQLLPLAEDLAMFSPHLRRRPDEPADVSG